MWRERARYWFDSTMSRGMPTLIGWLGLASTPGEYENLTIRTTYCDTVPPKPAPVALSADDWVIVRADQGLTDSSQVDVVGSLQTSR